MKVCLLHRPVKHFQDRSAMKHVLNNELKLISANTKFNVHTSEVGGTITYALM